MRFLGDERLYTDTAACLRFLSQLDGRNQVPWAGAPVRYHLYWEGRFGLKQAFAVKSFLATQDLDHAELWLWADGAESEGLDENPYLGPLRPFLEVKRFDPEEQVRGTPLEGVSELYRGATPTRLSNVVRHVVLYRHGGVYVDIDTMFLRDLGILRRDPQLSGEFCYRWSATLPYANSAVMGLEQGSETALALLKRCAETRSCRPKTVLDFEATRDLDLLVLPCAVFDPLWPHRDGSDAYDEAPFRTFDGFFRKFGWRFRRPRIQSHRDFFPGAFAYHWHNCWDAPEVTDSYFGLFNAEFDRLLHDRLGITMPARALGR